jgi:hypothetical protein
MTKSEFRELFMRAVRIAVENAQSKLAKPIPQLFEVELHAPGIPGRMVTADEALDQIYLGSDRCYRVIDVAVKGLRPGGSVIFVRVSGHSPVEYDETWDPSNLGPFKQVIADTIENLRH